MSTINQLTAVSLVSDADQFPIFSSLNGDARKAALSILADYIQTKITSTDDKLTQFSAPSTTGFTVQINDDNLSVWLVLTPTSDFSSGTLKLPSLINCKDKQEILINCTHAISILTIDSNGSTVIGAPTSLYANQSFRLRFDAVTQTWYGVPGHVLDAYWLQLELASTDTDKGASLVGFKQSGTGAISRTVYDKGLEIINVKDFGAVGDGISDDTSAILNFLKAGGRRIDIGTFLISNIIIDFFVNIECSRSVVFKKKSMIGDKKLITFAAGSEGSTWIGGVIDGNQSLWGGWTYQGIFNDWQGIAIETARIYIRDIKFVNWLNHPLVAPGDHLIAENLIFDTCATGPLFGWDFTTLASPLTNQSALGQFVRGISYINCGDVGVAGTLQHAFDTYACACSSYTDIQMINMEGAETGLSYAISGFTDKLSSKCTFDDIRYISPVGENVHHLAFSLLGTKNSNFTNLDAYNFAGLGLEIIDCMACNFDNVIIDGNYRATSYLVASSSKGLSLDKGAYTTLGGGNRGLSGNKRNSLSHLNVKRIGLGLDIKSGSCIVSDSNITGSIGTGIYLFESAQTTNFPGSADVKNYGIMLANVNSQFHGGPGVNIAKAQDIAIIGGNYSNNGQDSTLASTSRSGLLGTTATRVEISGVSLHDKQNVTVTNGLSFIPGSSDVNNKYKVSVVIPENYSEGQYITVVNGGGPAVNLIGKIIDIEYDQLTLQFSGATTFSASGNTIALTGTWSGDTKIITGLGSLAISEIVGPLYVTDGIEWRKVVSVTSNTIIVLESEFTTPLSGVTLNKLVCNMTGIPSQQYGYKMFSGITRLSSKALCASGNVLERTNISTATVVEPGSEYWRKTTTTITGSGTIVDLMTGIYNGQRIAGWALWNSAAISGGGATSMSLIHTDSTGTTKETLATGLSLSLNQKPRGGTSGTQVATNDKIVVSFAGGTPTTGTIVLEVYFVCELPELL